jgi:hypothetical protein
MVFTPKTNWANSPSTTTPITAAELVRIESGVAEGAQDASTTQKGNVELATSGEMTTGTDTTRVPAVNLVVSRIATDISDHVTSQPHLTTSSAMIAAQPVEVRSSGTLIGTRKVLNFISGANATINVQDNAGASRTDITISAATATTAPTARRERVFTFTGSAVAARQSQAIIIYQPETLVAVKVSSTAAPSGDPVIVDVLAGGATAEASIFGERPTLLIGEKNSARAISKSFNPGDSVRVEIDQAGSNLPGENVTITLVSDVTGNSYLDHMVNACQGSGITDEADVTTGNSGTPWDAFSAITKTGSGTVKYDSDAARLPVGFSYVTRLDSTASSDAYETWTFPDTSELFGRVSLNLDTRPASGSAYLVRLKNGTTRKAVIAVMSTGFIQLYNAAGTAIGIPSTTAITADTWFRLEFRVVGGLGSTGKFQVWIYTDATSDTATEILDFDADIGTTYNAVDFGRSGTGTSSAVLKMWQHSVGISTRGKLGRN